MFPAKSNSLIHFLSILLLTLFLASCVTAPKPVPVPVTPGKEVETLQSFVTLSVKSAGNSMGGRGYLIFKRPDRFHLVVLAPFGFTLMEVYVNGEHITCVVPSKQAAYDGSLVELPDHSALKGWSMMRWVVDNPPVTSAANGGTLERVGADGRKEFLFFDAQGLLQRKTNESGDQILYKQYRKINDVAFPESVELRNARNDTVKVGFEEPEINQQVEESAFTPNLEGYDVLPLSQFKGF